MGFAARLRKGLQNPGQAWFVARGLIGGRLCLWWNSLRGRRVTAGRNFRVWGPVYFQGPGRVQFGDDCQIASTRIAPTTIFTHVSESEILFGNSVRLTGMRIGCRSRIDVADGAGLAEGQIIDSDFHAVEIVDELRYRTPGRSKPIRIGANAWICAGAMVLKGVRIGENSIVGAGAVVGTSVPDNVVVFGNPARVIWRMKRAATPAANAAGAGGEAAT